MRIDGAGACFDNRVYELDLATAWQIAMLSINEMGVTMDEVDEANKVIHFHNKNKIMQVAFQQLDEETLQVIMDSTGKRLQIYSWKRRIKRLICSTSCLRKSCVNLEPLFCAPAAVRKFLPCLSSAPSAVLK